MGRLVEDLSNLGNSFKDFFIPLGSILENNIKISSYLGANNGEIINLKILRGYFICPDDMKNRKSSAPKIILEETCPQIFRKGFKEIYDGVIYFYHIIDEEKINCDYSLFKEGIKIAYVVAIAEYAREHLNKIVPTEIDSMYSKNLLNEMKMRMIHYLTNFIEYAKENNVPMKIYSIYPFAIKTLMNHGVEIRSDMLNVSNLLHSKSYAPYGVMAGEHLDNYMQKCFEDSQESEKLATILKSRIGDEGLLIPLDEDKVFSKRFERRPRYNIKIPDYIYVTKKYIYPLDLKMNLQTINSEQVDPENLEKLFMIMNDEMSVLFDGITVNGHTYLKNALLIPEKSYNSSLGVILKSNKVSSHDRALLEQLWLQQNPVTQEILHKYGVTGNLATIAKLFNGVLENKRKNK